ncbi:MAG TPA: 2,3-bisphosphoglycerate-independent phosphoglycerate mutase, partial [Ilumatobacteraceae bacterium]|nr:2,3-bisphosphoglycerate-independent phosphoglycerate mutase [Ilumatobacteraceae bacterium]
MGSASQLGRDRPLVLVVMDGVGVGSGDAFDEVALANTPTLDRLESGAYRTLRAHGTAVGLPSDADMGNSEVGHNILGAGRIFDQGAKRIDKAVASGAIWTSAAWRRVVEVCAGGGGTMHLIGLLSDGNVHSNISHLHEMLRQAAAEGITTIRIHALFDGRDVPDPSAERYIALTAAEFAKYPSVDIRFASGGGRMVTTM